MKRISTYQIYPSIPKPLAFLEVKSLNLWWCWKQDAITLFRRVEPQLWKESRGNPIRLLSNVRQKRLEELAKGVSPYYVSQQTGHSSINITCDIYGSWIRNEDNRYVNILDLNAPKRTLYVPKEEKQDLSVCNSS
jgi:hypothetical protein